MNGAVGKDPTARFRRTIRFAADDDRHRPSLARRDPHGACTASEIVLVADTKLSGSGSAGREGPAATPGPGPEGRIAPANFGYGFGNRNLKGRSLVAIMWWQAEDFHRGGSTFRSRSAAGAVDPPTGDGAEALRRTLPEGRRTRSPTGVAPSTGSAGRRSRPGAGAAAPVTLRRPGHPLGFRVAHRRTSAIGSFDGRRRCGGGTVTTDEAADSTTAPLRPATWPPSSPKPLTAVGLERRAPRATTRAIRCGRLTATDDAGFTSNSASPSSRARKVSDPRRRLRTGRRGPSTHFRV